MMTISTRNRVHFQIYHLNHISSRHQTRSIDSYQQGQYFQESFEQFVGKVLSSRSFSIYQPAQLLNNQLCQVCSVSFF